MPTTNGPSSPALITSGILPELLFDRMPMGIAIIDRAYRILRYNPTWEDFAARYAPAEGAPLQPGVNYFDFLPGSESTVLPLYQRVLAGETIRQEGVRLELSNGVTYWDVTLAPLIEDGEVVALLNVSVDATERVLARQTLEQRVEERTRELSTLLRISQDVSSTLTLDVLLGSVLDQLKAVLDYSGASLMALQGDALRILAYRGPIPAEEIARLRIAITSSPINEAVIHAARPVIIEDVRDDSPLAQAFRRTAGEHLDSLFGYIRCWMGVPLKAKGQVIGMLTLDHGLPGYYTAYNASLALLFANQAAIAIENARLLQEAEQRRSVAESLRETLSILNTSRPLDDILQHIVAQAQRLLQAQAVAVHKLDPAAGMLSPQASVGLSAEYAAQIRLPLGQGALGRAVLTRRPVAANDTTQVFQGQTVYTAEGEAISLDPSLTDRLRRFSDRYGAVLAAPMSVQGEVYGGLVLYYPTPHNFQPEEIELASTFAHQAALAIENALLREQSAQAAILAERNRLARDLHDAVTQTLFSASLIAEALPKLWERNPETGRQKLEELRLLTRGALSEMRTLLLELRPDALADVELGDLYRHLANAFSGRTRVPVTFTQDGQAALPAQVKETFYRVAQEALNNIAKHAGAGRVEIHLTTQTDRAEVAIRDDGVGFDPNALAPESMGLKIMRERAAAIGADLSIRSEPGKGTQVTMVWEGVSSCPTESES